MKNYLFGALAGGLTLFATGAICYLLLFPEPAFVMGEGAEAGLRESENIPLIIVMEIIFGLLLTLIFHKWAGICTFKTGLHAGAMIGLLLGLTLGMWVFATTTLYNVNIIVFYALTFAFRFAVAGGVVGWVLGKLKDHGKVAAATG